MSLRILMTAMSLDLGGAETHVVSLARRLKRCGHQVSVASSGGILKDGLSSSQIPHFDVPLQSRNPLDLLTAIKKLRVVIKDLGIDLVHAHGRIPAWTSGIAGKCTNVPLVTTYHGTYSASIPWRWFTRSGEISIAVSRDIKEHLVQKFGFDSSRIRIIPNGIDLEVFRPGDPGSARQEFGLGPDQPLAVYVSRLDEDTYNTAVAFARAMALTPNVSGLIVGEGNKQDEVETIAVEANKNAGRPCVFLTGGRTDVAPFLAAADVVVGAARVALEAMACKKPVILAGEGGFVGVISPENLRDLADRNFTARGLGTPCDPAVICEVLMELIADSARRKFLGCFGYGQVCREYSISSVTRAVEEVYQEVLGITSERGPKP